MLFNYCLVRSKSEFWVLVFSFPLNSFVILGKAHVSESKRKEGGSCVGWASWFWLSRTNGATTQWGQASQVAQWIKNLPAMQEMRVQCLGQEDPREESVATHSSILVWRIPWTEEPCGLQSIVSQGIRHRLKWLTTHIPTGGKKDKSGI